MIRITVLGTAGASPTKTRSLTSVSLFYDGNVLLFDCGEGTQMQILKYGVNYSRIRAIFLSHAHGDHVIGLAGLLRSMELNGRQDPLYIFVPQGYQGVVNRLITFDNAKISYKIHVKGIQSGKVYRGKDFTITAFKLDHTVSTYGYIFKIDDKRKFIEEKCRKLGLVGEMYGALQKKGSLKLGKRTVRLDDVTRIKVGKKIVYATDTRPTRSTVTAAKGADLLIHEATYADREKRLARERMHSTALEAAQIAKKAGVKELVLIHLSARYKNALQHETDAKTVFDNAVVAKDGDDIFI